MRNIALRRQSARRAAETAPVCELIDGLLVVEFDEFPRANHYQPISSAGSISDARQIAHLFDKRSGSPKQAIYVVWGRTSDGSYSVVDRFTLQAKLAFIAVQNLGAELFG